MSYSRSRFVRALMAVALTVLAAACGGGGSVPFPAESGVTQRPLSADFGSRKAVNYSPYRTANRDSEVVTTAAVKEDLQLLAAGGFKLIRLFDSSDAVAKLTLQVIRDNQLDIKVMLGVYVASGNDSFTQAEIARGIALANDPQFKDIVVAVSVGNETMVSWSFNKFTPAAMVTHIKAVRDKISQPVTTDDNWAFFAQAPGEPNDPKPVLAVIDFVAMHTYPLADSLYGAKWDWQQFGVAAGPARAVAMMDAAIAAAKSDFNAVRAKLDSLGYTSMPIVVGETGWKARLTNGELNRAHPANQKMYFERLNAWGAQSGAVPKSIFYFEAFDEPWKQTDDGWGLFTVERKARYVIQSLYPQASWDLVYADSDAVYAPDETSGGTGSATRYTVYADAVTTGEVRAPGIQGFGWDSPPLAYGGEGPDAAWPSDVPPSGTAKGLQIGPVPEAGPYNYGWGFFLIPTTTFTDLSSFNVASGRLNFSIKTTYPGKIEVGFFTGSAAAQTASDVYVLLDPATQTHGYSNDGNWHQVSIPISALIAAGKPAYNMPATAVPDLSKVAQPFVIADRYSVTGKTPNFVGKNTPIQIDAIYWSK